MEAIEQDTATKVRRVVDLQVLTDPPSFVFRQGWTHNTADYWKAVEEDLESWVKEFHDFIRDHRSQDRVTLRVERVEKECCSQCGEPWESAYGDGLEYCANCGAVLQQGKKGEI